jgi:hypothetical protein
MRITQIEINTQSVVNSFEGFSLVRSQTRRGNRAVFDLRYNEVPVGFGLVCSEIDQIMTVIGNMSFLQSQLNAAASEETSEEVMPSEPESESGLILAA